MAEECVWTCRNSPGFFASEQQTWPEWGYSGKQLCPFYLQVFICVMYAVLNCIKALELKQCKQFLNAAASVASF